MDEWMNGLMDGWIDGWMTVWDRSFVRPMDVEHVIDVMVWRVQV